MIKHNIVNAYRRWNFTDKQRRKMMDFDKEVEKNKKQQVKVVKQIHELDESLSKLRQKETSYWNRARTMLERLEKRCKHNGGRYVTEKYRDFGNDVIRSHCSQCGKILSSRDKDR